MTPTTSAIVSSRVNLTSATLARMVCVRSETISTLIAGGSEDCSCGSAFLMPSTVSITLAPGCRWTCNEHRRLARRTNPRASCLAAATTARPTSRTRDRGSIPVGEDVVVKTARGHELVVGLQREGMLAAVERAFRLIDGG